MLAQRDVKLGVPRSWGLPQPVVHLAQLEHHVLYSLDGETRRLPDEDRLRHLTVEEGRFYVQVMDTPVFCCCQSQKQSDRLHAHYRRKDFLEVDALALYKASGHEARLMLENSALLVPLDFVQPL